MAESILISLKSRLGKLLPDYRSEVFDTLPSTNSYLKENPSPGRLVVALRQTAGRGRYDRPFSSELGGLYMSFTPPLPDGAEIPTLTIAAGVAVCDTVYTNAASHAYLKWVNDVKIRGRKVGGILCEGVFIDGAARIIVGVGLNIENEIPLELRGIAANLSNFHCGGIRYEDVAADYAASIVRKTSEYFTPNGLSDGLLYRYKYLCSTPGTTVRAKIDGEIIVGTAVDIDKHGGLVVKYTGENEEKLVTLRYGEAEILKKSI